jgi:general secretion pathway protein G
MTIPPKISDSKAFTLIEMVLVLGIISLLVGSGIVYLSNITTVGKETRVKADFTTVTAALRTYETSNTFLPTSKQGLMALTEMPTAKPKPKNWKVLLKKILLDPWGNEYGYARPGKHDPDGFDIWSIGPDGKQGTADDMGNWMD